MAILLDTSIFIALERSRLAFDAVAALGADETAAIASVSVSELLVGVYRANTDERRKKREAFVEGILDAIPILPFDGKAARVHARLVADLTIIGTPIGSNDVVIAAIALANDCTILTHNIREFMRVPHLVVRRAEM